MQEARAVLLVEDSRAFAAALTQLIREKTDVTVVVASTLGDAVNTLEERRHEFFLVLLDLTLPDATGHAVVEAVAAFQLPIVVCSGTYDERVREWIMAAGAIDFIIKRNPSSIEEVASLVERLDRNRSIATLAVDDSPSHLKLIADHMERYLLKVFRTSSGQEALAVLDAHPEIRLVVVDYLMPGMDGHDLITTLRGKFSRDDLAIVGLSSAQGTVSALLLKAGANDFLHKPFLPEEFYCRIGKSLQHQETVRSLRDAAMFDFLTGIPNRRHFFESGRRLFANAKRGHVRIAVGVMDVDNFKRINDGQGHDVGDETLKAVAQILLSNQRETDIIGRLGGEEFGFVLAGPECSDWPKFFERVRIALASATIETAAGPVKVTASFGVCTELLGSMDEMLKRADESLYVAKKSGKNCVLIDGTRVTSPRDVPSLRTDTAGDREP